VRLFRVDSSDIVLLGSDAPLPLTAEGVRGSLLENPPVRADLAAIDFDSTEALLSLYLFDREKILELAGSVARNTDDNMRVEYSAPLHVHEDTEDANVVMMEGAAEIPLDAIEGRMSLMALARAYARWDDTWRRTLVTMEEAKARYPDDPEVDLLHRAFRRQAEQSGD